MMMTTTTIKTLILFSIGTGGLLAAGELVPGSFTQLGISGASLTVLGYVVTRTLPQMIREIMAGHAKANEQVCAKLDDVKRSIDDGRVEQLQVLRAALTAKGET